MAKTVPMAKAKLLKSSIEFLTLLEQNNDRDWFAKHKADYEKCRENVMEITGEVLHGLQKTDLIETPSPKSAMHRIYRDVRFFHDKRPYKLGMSASFRRAGRVLRGGYYFQLIPGGRSMVAGGFWSPNKEDLKHIRDQICLDDEPLRKAISSKEFKARYTELLGQQLKRAPKGFDIEHPSIDLLRYKQFLARHPLSDKEMRSASLCDIIVDNFQGLRPFFDAMSLYLTTDLNGEDMV